MVRIWAGAARPDQERKTAPGVRRLPHQRHRWAGARAACVRHGNLHFVVLGWLHLGTNVALT